MTRPDTPAQEHADKSKIDLLVNDPRLQTIRDGLYADWRSPRKKAAGAALASLAADLEATREALDLIASGGCAIPTFKCIPGMSCAACIAERALARLSAGKDDEAASEDPTAGLPADLVSALRDPNVVVPQDAALFDLLAKWKNAPSDTASAETPEGEGR